MDLVGRHYLLGFAAVTMVACAPEPEYTQTYDSEFTAAKRDFVVSGEESEFGVRYMGLDANGDPILQVLTPDLKRTDIIVEQAETDRMHLGGFGMREVTVIVVDATDALLTYRLKHDQR